MSMKWICTCVRLKYNHLRTNKSQWKERCLGPQDRDRHEVMKESVKRYVIKLKRLLFNAWKIDLSHCKWENFNNLIENEDVLKSNSMHISHIWKWKHGEVKMLSVKSDFLLLKGTKIIWVMLVKHTQFLYMIMILWMFWYSIIAK